MLYRLEALVRDKTYINTLEEYHHKNMRCIQHLPPAIAIPAIFLLASFSPPPPPVEALIVIGALTFFSSIAD